MGGNWQLPFSFSLLGSTSAQGFTHLGIFSTWQVGGNVCGMLLSEWRRAVLPSGH